MINIILYQPEIPPNTGNIIRTCYATNAILHIIKPLAFDLYHPLIKRAAAGREIQEIEHHIYDDYEDFKKKNSSKKIFYVTRYGVKNYTEPDFNIENDVWIMFGRESTGIPKEILSKNIDTCLRIPMTDKCRSLNLANSVSLMTYEILRQNNFNGLSLFENQKGKNFLLENNDE